MNDSIKYKEEMKARLKKFVPDQIKFCQGLPKTQEANMIKNQLLRSGSSVYANYRAACRARSKAEFFSKLSIVVEESDESVYWLEVIEDSKLSNNPDELNRLLKEAMEISKIMTKSKDTTYRSMNQIN